MVCAALLHEAEGNTQDGKAESMVGQPSMSPGL
jgi:hypothetical protein